MWTHDDPMMTAHWIWGEAELPVDLQLPHQPTYSNKLMIYSPPMGHTAFSSQDFTLEIVGFGASATTLKAECHSNNQSFCIVTDLQYFSEKLEYEVYIYSLSVVE